MKAEAGERHRGIEGARIAGEGAVARALGSRAIAVERGEFKAEAVGLKAAPAALGGAADQRAGAFSSSQT